MEKNGKSLAFLTYCDYDFPTIGYVPMATETTYGINPLDITRVVADIKRYKETCDYVIVLPHWGAEYNRFPTKKMKEYSRMMIETGADLIVGSHAHIVQPSNKYGRKHVFYGLGNFLFPDFYMTPPRPMWYPPVDYDFHSIGVTYNYPFPINSPMKRVWKDASRVGLMVEGAFGKKVKVHSRLSILSADNVLDFYDDKRLQYRLKVLGMVVSFPFYDGGVWIGKVMGKIRGVLSKKQI